MAIRRRVPVALLVFTSSFIFLAPSVGLAYGPGVGWEMLPYFFTLLAGVIAALGSVLLWPIRTLIHRLRRGPQDTAAAAASQSQVTHVEEPGQALPVEAPGEGIAPTH